MFNGLELLSDLEKQKVVAAINRLLAINFLVKEKDRESYLLVRRHKELFHSFFRFLGWDLVVDERHECLFVQGPGIGLRSSLNKDESVWLLVLRLLYQEKRESLTLSSFPMVTLYEIRSKYGTFQLPWVQVTMLDKLIRLCTRYHLLEPLDNDQRSDDCRIRLFHTWLYVLDTDRIQTITERIERYQPVRGGGLPDEMDEEAATD